MNRNEILHHLDEIARLDSQAKHIMEKIMSIKQGDLTVCTNNQILTPEEQTKMLFPKWENCSTGANQHETLLASLSDEELLDCYLFVTSTPESIIKETRLNNLALLLGRIKKQEQIR